MSQSSLRHRMNHYFFNSSSPLFVSILTAVLLLNSTQSYAVWTRDYILPPLSTNTYTEATESSILLSVAYSSQSAPPNNMPTVPLGKGQNMRIRVLAPPGVASVSIRAESNNWQGPSPGTFPIMASFDTDPGELCPIQSGIGTSCSGVSGKYVYFDDLHPAGGGLNEQMYGSGHPGYTPLNQPRYLYFVLYHPTGAREQFQFESLRISMLVTDVDAYNTWRSARPWAGGSTINSNTGIEGDDAIVEPDPTPQLPTTPVPAQPSASTGDTVITVPTPSGDVIITTPSADAVAQRPISLDTLIVDLGTPNTVNSRATVTIFGTVLESLGSNNSIPIENGMSVEDNAFINIRANIVPDSEHGNVNVFALAGWRDDDVHKDSFSSVLWAQKFRPHSFFGSSDLSWQPWQGPTLNDRGEINMNAVASYQKQVSTGAEGYTVNLGDGEMTPPDELGDTGRVLQLFIGYIANAVIGNPFDKAIFHVVSMPLELHFPDRTPLLIPELEIDTSVLWVASNPDNHNPISSCRVDDPDLVELTIANYGDGNIECLIKGLHEGNTVLTAQAANGQSSTSQITVTVPTAN